MYSIARRTYSHNRRTPWVLQILGVVRPSCYDVSSSIEDSYRKLKEIADAISHATVRRYKSVVPLCSFARVRMLSSGLVVESLKGVPILHFDIKES